MPELGKRITQIENRDAIHVAIAPVVAAHNLKAGQHVGLTPAGQASNSAVLTGMIRHSLLIHKPIAIRSSFNPHIEGLTANYIPDSWKIEKL